MKNKILIDRLTKFLSDNGIETTLYVHVNGHILKEKLPDALLIELINLIETSQCEWQGVNGALLIL